MKKEHVSNRCGVGVVRAEKRLSIEYAAIQNRKNCKSKQKLGGELCHDLAVVVFVQS